MTELWPENPRPQPDPIDIEASTYQLAAEVAHMRLGTLAENPAAEMWASDDPRRLTTLITSVGTAPMFIYDHDDLRQVLISVAAHAFAWVAAVDDDSSRTGDDRTRDKAERASRFVGADATPCSELPSGEVPTELLVMPLHDIDPYAIHHVTNPEPICTERMPDGRLFINDGRHRALRALLAGRPMLPGHIHERMR